MNEKQRKKQIKDNADYFIDNAIGFVISSPCSICANDMPHRCWAGYKNRGACPIYKGIEKRLSKLKSNEVEE